MITDIYLDTMLWNALFDNGVDPRSFVRALAQKNGRPVLGLHTFYEFAKTFQSKKKNGLGRAKDLFSYFKLCVEAGVPVGKDNMELLTAEMWALKLRASKPRPSPFRTGSQTGHSGSSQIIERRIKPSHN